MILEAGILSGKCRKKKNLEGNFINGRALAKDTKDSLIISEDKLVVSIGLENVVIVETRDAVLVSKKKLFR
jgi:mannose-1-phosphate guanylyltransferase